MSEISLAIIIFIITITLLLEDEIVNFLGNRRQVATDKGIKSVTGEEE
jgi:hypothetical protein